VSPASIAPGTGSITASSTISVPAIETVSAASATGTAARRDDGEHDRLHVRPAV